MHLQPEVQFQATWDDGTVAGEGSGAEISRDGLILRRPPYSGGIVWIEPQG